MVDLNKNVNILFRTLHLMHCWLYMNLQVLVDHSDFLKELQKEE